MKRMLNSYDRLIEPLCVYFSENKSKRRELAHFIEERYGRPLRTDEINRWFHPNPTKRIKIAFDIGVMVMFWFCFVAEKEETRKRNNNQAHMWKTDQERRYKRQDLIDALEDFRTCDKNLRQIAKERGINENTLYAFKRAMEINGK